MNFGWDRGIAFFCLLVGAFTSWFSYQALQETERVPAISIEHMELGDHLYVLRHGNLCVGQFKMNVGYDSSLTLSVSGEIRVRGGGGKDTVRIVGTAVTNALDQLTQGTFAASSTVSNAKLQLELRNVNPIHLSFKTEPSTAFGNLRFDIDGPITIARGAHQNLLFSNLSPRAHQSLALQSVWANLHNRISQQGFALVPQDAATSAKNCEDGALDPQRLISELLPIVPAIQETFGEERL